MTLSTVPYFSVVTGAGIHDILHSRERQLMDIVEAAYRLHGEGRTVNPPSYFLTFPDRPSSRIIALPASLAGHDPVDGIKWISSFPENIEQGLPRASAVIILNDALTGYPLACMEGSIISATRTAASAALAARELTRTRTRPRRLGIVGLGLIARYVLTYLVADGWDFDEIHLYDLDPRQATTFTAGPVRQHGGQRCVSTVHETPERLIESCDLVLFTTVAAEPYVGDPSCFGHHPVVLHVSLRDLAPDVMLASANFVDDVDHCLRAGTSAHLAEQHAGGREFVSGTMYDVLSGRIKAPKDETVVFSPFGLGVLDLAVAHFIWTEAHRSGRLLTIPDFFHDLSRHG